MKKKTGGCAVVEISANDIKMGIYQAQKNNIVCLDDLLYPLNLGHEIFGGGKVEFGTINELNNILAKYKIACESYGIDNIKVVSATVMREATNSELIADRIFTQNKLMPQKLADSKEKSMICFDIISKLKQSQAKINKATIAYIGSGSMGIAKFDGENITSSSYIPLGAVKLYDIMQNLQSEMSDYHEVIEEYVHTVLNKIDMSNCENMVLTGVQVNEIAKLCGAEESDGIYSFKKSELEKLHHSLKNMTSENVGSKFSISEEKANMLLTSLSICYEIVKDKNISNHLRATEINLREIIARQTLLDDIMKTYEKHIYESSISTALLQASKYNCDKIHINTVRENCNILFDKLKKIHGMELSHKKILELSSILYSCGQYINTRQSFLASFDLIKNMDIYGLSKEEISLVAMVSSYDEQIWGDFTRQNLFENNSKTQIIVAKLMAIFSLSVALDKSHKGKIKIEKIKIDGDNLTIKVSSDSSCKLEEWAFAESSKYFLQIFGINPKLSVKYQYEIFM